MKNKSKRLKTVFRNLEGVIEKYVAQSQPFAVYRYIGGGGWFSGSSKGERQDACYFKGKKIFSYGDHYLLGQIDLEHKGVKFSVVNFTKYSNATSSQSWYLRRKLMESGRLVVSIYARTDSDGDAMESIDYKTGDAKLIQYAMESMKNKRSNIETSVFEATFKKTSWWGRDWANFSRDIANHNKLVSKMRMRDLAIKVPAEMIHAIREVSRLNKIAGYSQGSIQQLGVYQYGA